MPLPTIFHLKRNDELLAIFEACKPSEEMFWLTCNFELLEGFSEVEPLFHEDKIQQLQDSGVFLLDVEKNINIIHFVIHFDKDQVFLRYAES